MKRRKKAILTLLGIVAGISFIAGFCCGRLSVSRPAEPIAEPAPLQEIGDDNDYLPDETDGDIPAETNTDTIPPIPIDTVSEYDNHLDEMPNNSCVRLRVKPIRGSLGRVFNDSNYLHLAEAQQIGIQPISSPAHAWQVRRPICRVRSCANFVVDNLTHSYPYLVPEAAELLDEIGSRFNDSLAARGGGQYRIKVTSLLRTENTIRRLRRRNINAVSASAHQYGTTFDISYVNFICDRSTATNRTQQDLKNLLGEVLSDLRDEGRCLVKYERKQGCFHITACSKPTQQP